MALLRLRACTVVGALVALAAVVPAWAGPPPAAEATGPVAVTAAKRQLDHMVVLRAGRMLVTKVRAPATTVRVTKRKRCAVAAWTPLAALVRAKPGKVLLKDFGGCTDRPRDGAGLFVRSIRGQQNRGQDGWVYKVGRRLGTAGVADPSGPFGNGRLRGGQRLLWFYCVYADGSCQRTLEVKVQDKGGGEVSALVRGYDDAGRGVPIEGAKVTAGPVSAVTGVDGRATLTLARGLQVVYASKPGTIRSFGERVTVR